MYTAANTMTPSDALMMTNCRFVHDSPDWARRIDSGGDFDFLARSSRSLRLLSTCSRRDFNAREIPLAVGTPDLAMLDIRRSASFSPDRYG
jgi:hypothetical protein